MSEPESFQRDLDFLRSCHKRMDHLLCAMEGVPSLREIAEKKAKAQRELEELRASLKGQVRPLVDVERAAILAAVQMFEGDKRAAAKALGIGKTTFYRKLKEYRKECEL